MEYAPTLRDFWSRPQRGSGECAARQHTVVEPNQLPRRGLSTMLQLHRPHLIGSYRFTPFNHRIHKKAIDLPRMFPKAGSVASVCVWPVFVETVGLAAGDSKLAITSVAGGFPSSQTYLEVKNARNRHGYRKRCR